MQIFYIFTNFLFSSWHISFWEKYIRSSHYDFGLGSLCNSLKVCFIYFEARVIRSSRLMIYISSWLIVKLPFTFKKKYLFIYLFIWLRQVLVAACRIFVVACRIFSCGMWDLSLVACGIFQLQHAGSLVVACRIFSCSRQTLSCGMWDLVPWPGIKPGPPALGAWSLSHWSTRKIPTPSLSKIHSSQKAFVRSWVT